MGLLTDYFTAESDEMAAAALEHGPAGDFDTLQTKGIDPVVQMGTLEELLTGRSYDDVADDPRNGHPVAMADGGERMVLTLTDGLVEALARASRERLAEVAVPWSETEESEGQADPAHLAEVLAELSELAGRAQAAGQNVYCWICV